MRTLLVLAALAASTAARADPPRHIALATDPLGLINGTYVLHGVYAFNDHVALTAEGVRSSEDGLGTSTSMTRLQGGVRLFLDRAFQGPFVEAGVRRQDTRGIGYVLDQNGMASPYVGDYMTFGPRASVGWQWTFHDTWSISYAIGTSKVWTTNASVLGFGMAPEHELRVGFVF